MRSDHITDLLNITVDNPTHVYPVALCSAAVPAVLATNPTGFAYSKCRSNIHKQHRQTISKHKIAKCHDRASAKPIGKKLSQNITNDGDIPNA